MSRMSSTSTARGPDLADERVVHDALGRAPLAQVGHRRLDARRRGDRRAALERALVGRDDGEALQRSSPQLRREQTRRASAR